MRAFLASPEGAALAALAAVTLVSWLAERLRRRRLERFGDLDVLPRPVSRGRRAAAAAAFALACAAVSSLFVLHAARGRPAAGDCALRVDLLVGGAATAEERASIGDPVAAIVRLLHPGTCVALFRAGDTPELVVPRTFDREAVIRIAATALEPAAPSAERLLRSLDALAKGETGGRRLVVVVSAVPDEIAALEPYRRAGRPEVWVVPFGSAASRGDAALAALEASLAERPEAEPRGGGGADPARLLAAGALAALAAESLLQRARSGASS